MKENDYQYIRNNTDENVDLSIELIVYNHGAYIRQAIESILMQKTQYSYKIIVGEDCSTDNSRDILLEYYEKYPEKIELILWNHNVGVEINSVEITKKCRGRYIAYLEGDDYWTDPLKIQKQISFLQTNKQYIGTAHNVRCVDQNGNFLHKDYGLYSYKEDHVYGLEDVKRIEMVGQTAGILHRNMWNMFTEENWQKYFECKTNGDLKTSLILGSIGDLYFMHDIMADHRRVFVGDSWTAKTNDKNMLWFNYQTKCQVRNYILSEFNIKLEFSLKNLVATYYKESIIQMLYQPCKENFRIMLKFFWENRRLRKKLL